MSTPDLVSDEVNLAKNEHEHDAEDFPLPDETFEDLYEYEHEDSSAAEVFSGPSEMFGAEDELLTVPAFETIPKHEDEGPSLPVGTPEVRKSKFSKRELKVLLLLFEGRRAEFVASLQKMGKRVSESKTRLPIEAWAEIARRVSSVDRNPRGVDQCKKKVENIRNNQSMEVSEYLKQYLENVQVKAEWVEGESSLELNDEQESPSRPRRRRNFSHRETRTLIMEYQKSQIANCENREDKKLLWEDIAAAVSRVEGEARDVTVCKKKIMNIRTETEGNLEGYLEALSVDIGTGELSCLSNLIDSALKLRT
jgi:hypothetical protein